MSVTNYSASSLAAKKATAIPTTAQIKRGGAYSVNIVCAKNNRKSLTLTKKLADALELSADVYITVYADDGCIALSPAPIDENSAKFSFSNAKDHIVYNANLVCFIAETFTLDYTGRTSMSFKNIKFGSVNGVRYAEVILSETTAGTLSISESEQKDEDPNDDSNP